MKVYTVLIHEDENQTYDSSSHIHSVHSSRDSAELEARGLIISLKMKDTGRIDEEGETIYTDHDTWITVNEFTVQE